MTNRREFLQAAAISGLPVIGGAAQIADAARTRVALRADLHAVLIDERHPEARGAGTCLAGVGASVYAVPDGDVTQIWLRQIGPTWRDHPAAIAGLTERPALFCLEQLALSCGLRVVFHCEHIVHPGGQTEHSLLRGAEGAHLFAQELRLAGSLWPACIADAIAARRQQARPARLGPSVAALEPSLPPGAQLLTSWIIAAA